MNLDCCHRETTFKKSPLDFVTMPSERDVTRRYLLQTGAAALATGLAGCSGGNNSDGSDETDEENSSDVDTTPEETAEPEPDYSLPESEHANPVDMATEWMIFPDDQGDDLEAVALSPSAFDENYDASFAEEIGADEKYEVFEFNHTDIPETYIQDADDPWDSKFKVDQLPKNVTKAGLGHQLKDAGYEFREEKGDFDVYEGEDGLHAIGDDRHIVVLQGSIASTSKQRDLMFRVLEESNENRYEIPETIQNGLDAVQEQDSLTISMHPAVPYMPSVDNSSYQPELGIASVNFETGEKYGAWPFIDEQSAENALTFLENHEGGFNDGFENISLNGSTITASGGEYGLNQMNYSNQIVVSDTRL